MSKYKEFERKFKACGLTQKAYAEKHDMSKSMVSYYLRRSRQENLINDNEKGFTSVELTPSSRYSIEIRTPGGLHISIPVG